MPAPTLIDSSSTQAQGLLDSLFGTAGKSLDLWFQWKDKKLEAEQIRASYPTTATTNTPSVDSFGGVSSKVWIIIGVGVAAVLGLVLVLRGK